MNEDQGAYWTGDATEKTARRKQVVIFGAGIAGLTAAHELSERGFEVDVYEREEPSAWDTIVSGARCSIGGMARTQWSRTARRFGVARTKEMQATEPIQLIDDLPMTESVGVRRKRSVAAAEDWRIARVRAQLRKLNDKTNPGLKTVVEVRGFCDQVLPPLAFDYLIEDLTKIFRPKPNAKQPSKQPDEELVKDRPDVKLAWRLAEGFPAEFDRLVFHIRGMGLGHREDWTRSKEERNFVRFTVQEEWVPGEHGFRFFPAFYRNLFDTMRRTPIASDTVQYGTGSVFQESARTVLDNIIPTEMMGMKTAKNSKPFGFRRQAVRSLEEILEQGIGMLKAMGFPLADLNRFQLKLFTYMTTCRDRRKAKYENQTWWEFLEAERFSKPFRRYLDTTAEALVAMNAKKSDARTYGNVSLQMLHDQLSSGDERVDGTLNGPTSVAWFDHWRRYLQHQGVNFHQGELMGFEWHDRHPWAIVRRHDWPPHDHETSSSDSSDARKKERIIGRDYYVLALPVKEMEEIAKSVRKQIEDASGPSLKDVPPALTEDFRRVCEMNWGDPTQADPGGSLDHMAGIQFFFDGDVKILNGHLLYPDTPWRLSAVGQPQFWRAKRGWWSGYRGILSVDISNWHNPGDAEDAVAPGQAWDKSKRDLAFLTWEQIRGQGGPPSTSTSTSAEPSDLPRPVLYHVDENIIYDKETGRPSLNLSPLLINRSGEFLLRPGSLDKEGYQLSFESIALAGTFMQTFTRLTTMESANESGRHAVNAILRQELIPKEEWCQIYDPEDHEPPDLRQLIAMDKKLFELGLPHFTEILDMTEVPRSLLRANPDLSTLGLPALIQEAAHAKA